MNVSFLDESVRIFSYNKSMDSMIKDWISALPYPKQYMALNIPRGDTKFVLQKMEWLSEIARTKVGRRVKYAPRFFITNGSDGFRILGFFGAIEESNFPADWPLVFGYGCVMAFDGNANPPGLIVCKEIYGATRRSIDDISDKKLAILCRDLKSLSSKVASCQSLDKMVQTMNNFRWSWIE